MEQISVYCVGIHFRHKIPFKADLTAPNGTTPTFMSGGAILAACAEHFGLRYKLSANPPSAVGGHLDYVSYTPTLAHDPVGVVRVTFPLTAPKVFPFYGQPLSLTEILAPIGQPSQVLQYTVEPLIAGTPSPVKLLIPNRANPPVPTPPPDFDSPNPITPASDGRSSFGVVGFPPDVEIRIRSLNIYCTY